ncbi:hypothetical protein JZ751_028585 [Albula glossodonta]|uniref:Ephexin-1 n=1 Tax=Albula glossodonta TaxID=121402 RepID=A0A8T2NB45_9TELE|nr:hypothetical protein JZ751_028585 [Albula glossodonta]
MREKVKGRFWNKGNTAFRETMAQLENQPRVRGLSFTSFLILPFQRITRLKLLVQIVKECNEGVRKMSRTEELISIEKTLEFKSKSVPVISHSRWLLKKGELQQMSGPKSTRTMRSRKLYHPVYLFLFNNLLLITKRSSRSDKLRWICALTPNRRTRFLSTSTHQSDSPQVQCIQSYSSQEPDELSIEMADVLNILEKTDDGWMMGERLHDGEKGWFPCRVVEEIQNQEIRAQNLRECQKIHQAHGGSGSAAPGSRGRRTTKVTNF